jgi:hypothetical protein
VSFKRYVRRVVLPVSVDLPAGLAEESLRLQLTVEQRHSIIESTWTDDVGEDEFLRPARAVSVRYVTGGQRHGLPPSLPWDKAPDVVEFASPAKR